MEARSFLVQAKSAVLWEVVVTIVAVIIGTFANKMSVITIFENPLGPKKRPNEKFQKQKLKQ